MEPHCSDWPGKDAICDTATYSDGVETRISVKIGDLCRNNRKMDYVTREEGKPDRYPWVTVHNRSQQVYRPGDFPEIRRPEHLVAPTRCAAIVPRRARAHGQDASQSSHDLRYAMRALGEGVAEETVKAAIIRDRSADKKHPNVRDYADRTVRKAAEFISRSTATPDR